MDPRPPVSLDVFAEPTFFSTVLDKLSPLLSLLTGGYSTAVWAILQVLVALSPLALLRSSVFLEALAHLLFLLVLAFLLHRIVIRMLTHWDPVPHRVGVRDWRHLVKTH